MYAVSLLISTYPVRVTRTFVPVVTVTDGFVPGVPPRVVVYEVEVVVPALFWVADAKVMEPPGP